MKRPSGLDHVPWTGADVATDCHDGSQMAAVNGTDGTFSPGGPCCYTGGTLQAVALGTAYKF